MYHRVGLERFSVSVILWLDDSENASYAWVPLEDILPGGHANIGFLKILAVYNYQNPA